MWGSGVGKGVCVCVCVCVWWCVGMGVGGVCGGRWCVWVGENASGCICVGWEGVL